jgi:hypothetical protein
MCSLEKRSALFESKISQIPCNFSLLAGNLTGERLARDCALRHTVCVAEKSGCVIARIAENCRNILSLAFKAHRRKCFEPSSQIFCRFLGMARAQPDLSEQANVVRLQTDDAAKAPAAFASGNTVVNCLIPNRPRGPVVADVCFGRSFLRTTYELFIRNLRFLVSNDLGERLRAVIQGWDRSLENEMFVAAVTMALCVAGVAFCVRLLLALCNESSRGRVAGWAVSRLGPGEGVVSDLQRG